MALSLYYVYGAIGRGLSNVKLHVLDEQNRPVSPDEPGELVIEGECPHELGGNFSGQAVGQLATSLKTVISQMIEHLDSRITPVS